MPEQDDLNVEGWETNSLENVFRWPFEVPPSEERTEHQQKEIEFFQTAYDIGYRPYLWHGEYRLISPTGREIWAIWRGRRRQDGPTQWEVRLFTSKYALAVSYWVDDFDAVSMAGLEWLRGCEFKEILPMIQGHIVRGPLFEAN